MSQRVIESQRTLDTQPWRWFIDDLTFQMSFPSQSRAGSSTYERQIANSEIVDVNTPTSATLASMHQIVSIRKIESFLSEIKNYQNCFYHKSGAKVENWDKPWVNLLEAFSLKENNASCHHRRLKYLKNTATSEWRFCPSDKHNVFVFKFRNEKRKIFYYSQTSL